MKRWNRKGTSHAKERMAELRLRALEYARNDMARDYEGRFVAGILTAAAIITALGAAIQHGGLKMSASFARPSPTKQAIVDSLLITPPQSLEHVTDALKAASIDAGWAANVPTDEMLEEAELSLGRAYRAVVAWRGK